MTLRNGDTVSGKVLATISSNVILESKNYTEFSTETDKDVDNVQIPFEDIQSIEKRGFSVGKTLGLVVGIAAPLVLMGVTSDGMGMGGGGGGDLGSFGLHKSGW